jgi:hypothetical protein
MPGLIESINTYSVPELRKERERVLQTMESKKRAIDLATKDYNVALASLRLLEFALQVREAGELANGHNRDGVNPSNGIPVSAPSPSASPSTSPLSSDEQDKTAFMLELLKHNRMRPSQLYNTLVDHGIKVKKQYVGTVLQRLKKRKLVSVENGEYFAKAA